MPSLPVRRVWPWLALAALALLFAVPRYILGDMDRLTRMAERSLTRQFGLPVRIGRLERIGGWWWAPDFEEHDLVVGQAGWVGSRVPLAHLRRVRVHLSFPAMLLGRRAATGVVIDGGAVVLKRNSDGRGNWTDKLPGSTNSSGSLPGDVTIHDLRLIYDDVRRERRADVIVRETPADGIVLRGRGLVRGAPVAIAAHIGLDGGFTARVDGPSLGVDLRGRLDQADTLAAFSAHIVARGHDLRDLDALVEAGLPGTQPFTLTGEIRREPESWDLTRLTGRIGRSPITGAIRIDRHEDRSTVTGTLHASALDFDDLSSDEGLARGAARLRQFGPRVVPETPIALDHLQQTDGTLDVRADRLLWTTPSAFRSMAARLALDHGRLTVSRLHVGLAHGQVTGSATITQQGQVPARLRTDLRLTGGRIEDFVTAGDLRADLRGRVVVDGAGPTVRAAMAGSGGRIAFVTTDGSIDAHTAELMGRNVGRALKTGAGDRVSLRCVIADFRGKDGRFVADPFLVDTAVARADSRGAVDFRGETLAMTAAGGSKVPAAFRISGTMAVKGTIKRPILIPPAGAVSAGGLLKMVGRAIAGEKEAAAPDADCAALARRALG